MAPYDTKLIELAHEAGQQIADYTCGGMMRILEDNAAMKPDAMETFTPPNMGGDAQLAEAKRRIGALHVPKCAAPQKTEVRNGFFR